MSPHDLAEWLWEVGYSRTDPLTLDIGPDHTLLVVDEQGEVVAERTIVVSP